MEALFSPEIIEAASTSKLGVLSLMVIVIGSLCFFFFRDSPHGVKLTVFLVLFLGIFGYGKSVQVAYVQDEEFADTAIAADGKIEPEPEPEPEQPLTVPEKTTQTFRRTIGDDSSCTESNVRRVYELCLAEEYVVERWEGRPLSERNASAEVVRDTSKDNCVSLTLSYSDSGRNFIGDCQGNGWIDYEVDVTGLRK